MSLVSTISDYSNHAAGIILGSDGEDDDQSEDDQQSFSEGEDGDDADVAGGRRSSDGSAQGESSTGITLTRSQSYSRSSRHEERRRRGKRGQTGDAYYDEDGESRDSGLNSDRDASDSGYESHRSYESDSDDKRDSRLNSSSSVAGTTGGDLSTRAGSFRYHEDSRRSVRSGTGDGRDGNDGDDDDPPWEGDEESSDESNGGNNVKRNGNATGSRGKGVNNSKDGGSRASRDDAKNLRIEVSASRPDGLCVNCRVHISYGLNWAFDRNSRQFLTISLS